MHQTIESVKLTFSELSRRISSDEDTLAHLYKDNQNNLPVVTVETSQKPEEFLKNIYAKGIE